MVKSGMKFVDTYQNRKVFWFDYEQFEPEDLPTHDWLCFTTSDIKPDAEKLSEFFHYCIERDVLEFKGHGKFGELLHDTFDMVMVDKEQSEEIDFIDIGTTSHEGESLAYAFWQCFFATTLPLRTNFDELSIVCTDISGKDRSSELKNIIVKFKEGWLPED